MNDYIEVRFDVKSCTEPITDVLAALLCDIEYESFVPDEKGLIAYVKKELFDENKINIVLGDFPFENEVSYKYNFVEGQDWNSEWEKNYFKPIIVKDKCVIHSSFHKDIPSLPYDIVIDPKMAFGTGHHATTSLIIEQLVELNLRDKSVIDMGTGTGILAILASMRGAKPITAIEIDPVAHANAVDNIIINDAKIIELILGDATALVGKKNVDVFIANINRNIITQDIDRYVKTLNDGGIMLLSGFYEVDIPVILNVAKPLGLDYDSHSVKDDWTCLRLLKK